MSERSLNELTIVEELSQQKQQELENEKQSVCGQSLIATNEDREEADSLKQQNKKLKTQIQTLRAQNELLRAQLLQQNNNRRESFSERVCDDLSEVILQFLPIEDKFRFECVSKQFQRTVYRRQYELIINDKVTQNLLIFESILQKLPHIKSVDSNILLNDSEIELIIKYCNHLIEFKAELSQISERIKQLFADKFGPQLTSIQIKQSFELRISDPSYKSIISSFVNIRDIKTIDFRFDKIYPKIKSKALKKVSAIINKKDSLNEFIDNNKGITQLSIEYDSRVPIEPNFEVISQLNQLVSLQLIFREIDLKSLTNGLKQLSLNCRKLKSLSLKFDKINKNFENNDFMSEIRKFNELKRFKLRIEFDNSIEFEDYFINSLKTGFENLTHLTIYFKYYGLNETFIENIVSYLPNIQTLIIGNEIKATERTADILSRLSKLETLGLNINDKSIKYLFKNQIKKKCRNIKTLFVNSNNFLMFY